MNDYEDKHGLIWSSKAAQEGMKNMFFINKIVENKLIIKNRVHIPPPPLEPLQTSL